MLLTLQIIQKFQLYNIHKNSLLSKIRIKKISINN